MEIIPHVLDKQTMVKEKTLKYKDRRVLFWRCIVPLLISIIASMHINKQMNLFKNTVDSIAAFANAVNTN